MILQRDAPIEIFGTSLPNERVSVHFNLGDYDTYSDQNGNWILELPEMLPGGPFVLKVTTESETLFLEDILIGDVWFCSGQSNMAMTLGQDQAYIGSFSDEINSNIRFFNVPNDFSEIPSSNIERGDWIVPCSSSVGSLSALAYFFSLDLHNDIGIPIGIVNSSWGGSKIEHWMEKDSSMNKFNDPLKSAKEINKLIDFHAVINTLRLQFPNLSFESEIKANCDYEWNSDSFDDQSWPSEYVPSEPNKYLSSFIGSRCYRRDFYILEEHMIKGDAILGLGYFMNSTATIWVNGQELPNSGYQFNTPLEIVLPSSFLQLGKNQISVRLENYVSNAGLRGFDDDFYCQINDHRHSLAGEWKYNLECVFVVLTHESFVGDMVDHFQKWCPVIL